MAASGGAIAGVVYQCAACRSLVSVRTIVVDNAHERAALGCDLCGARTWLPTTDVSGASNNASATARVVDVEHAATTSTALALASSSVAAATALVPTATAPAAVMTTATWSSEQRARIDDRIAKLAPSGAAQAELASSFTRLLSSWASEAEHKQFLKKASMVGELAFAGQRYRAVLSEAPSDAHAKKAQNDILGLAMASMSREKDLGSTSASGRGKKVAAAVIVLVGALACIAIIKSLPSVLAGADVDVDVAPGPDQGGQNIAPPEPGR